MFFSSPAVMITLIVFVFLAFAGDALAQPAVQGALRVYVDCQEFTCDQDYFRNTLSYLDFVRNREDAHALILLVREQTGSGGRRYVIRTRGQQVFAGWLDEHSVSLEPETSDHEVREALGHAIGRSLVRYLAATPLAPHVRVEVHQPTSSRARTNADAWNSWVFSVGASGYFSGDANYEYLSTQSFLSASRITDRWKTENWLTANREISRVEYSAISARTQRQEFNALSQTVYGRSPHWSGGMRLGLRHSDFNNVEVQGRVQPVVEYSLFPYTEATNRAIRMNYAMGWVGTAYQDTTLYGKTSEHLMEQVAEMIVSYRQPWGTVSSSLEARHFVQYPGEYRLRINGQARLNLVRGLSLNLYTSYITQKDQRELRRQGATEEDVLLQRRALQTNYELSVEVGLSYTFGAVSNSIVNPRLKGF